MGDMLPASSANQVVGAVCDLQSSSAVDHESTTRSNALGFSAALFIKKLAPLNFFDMDHQFEPALPKPSTSYAWTNRMHCLSPNPTSTAQCCAAIP